MTLGIHSIKKPTANKTRKRVGRGNASGHGTYSGKGQKGQKSRSGVSRMRLKLIGMKRGRSPYRGVPKLRGFKSIKPENQIVKTVDINKNFKDGDLISPQILLKKGLINTIKRPVKMIGKEQLAIKNLKIEKIKLTKKISDEIK